jgi:adenylate cyclase
VPEKRRIRFRIGINLGDVIVEPHDIFGDGVNVAARLETLAEPGGVLISNAVHDHVRDRLPFAFEDLGDQQVKNIARPVRVYRVRDRAMPAEVPAPASPQPLPLPDKPSIAVLPFTNMSRDPEQEFFADGIAEDVITALSHYPSLFVISRNSCFTYKGRAVDVKQVGRGLGVRYVLEGGLRKSGNRIRVTAQLVEAESGKHVWAGRYDRELADLFAVQDEIAEAVTIAIAPAIADAEQKRAMRRPPGSLDAWAAYQRGMWHLGRGNADDNVLAQSFFSQAIELDPNFAGSYAGLAETYTMAATQFHTCSLADIEKLQERAARRAVALDPGDAYARVLFGVIFLLRGDDVAALAEVERALALTPNLADAHATKGVSLILSGKAADGISSLLTSIKLDPRSPLVWVRLSQIVLGHYLAGEYAAAARDAEQVIRSYPHNPSTYRYFAAALGQLGLLAQARNALDKAMTMAPTAFYMYVRNRPPWMRPEDHAVIVEGLRKAGMPEE